ncbi:MAG: YggS family pyridoxal phosphate-dependent enzyme [Bacteroidetes bacterium]|nr:MAG: YggS family pyridoxal phosphate-dependent enzyme [Bacteroidota bacterium]
MGISENLRAIGESLPGHVQLVAVSKTKPDDLILEAYQAGQRDFGENKVQELQAKQLRLPADIRWHMIGHLQRNKVKYLAPFVHLIHGVDSLRLLESIDREAAKNQRCIDCLLQLHIARESSKFGMNEEELRELLSSESFRQMAHVRVRGLMGMASYTENTGQIRAEFRRLKRIFDQLKDSGFHGDQHFDLLSCGMSGDFQLAIEEGSNMVRIGSLIFGARQKH